MGTWIDYWTGLWPKWPQRDAKWRSCFVCNGLFLSGCLALMWADGGPLCMSVPRAPLSQNPSLTGKPEQVFCVATYSSSEFCLTFFFFGEKWWQISEPHFSVCVSGHHKSESFIDMIPHEIIYIQYDNDRWAPLFNLCSLFPLSARLGRVLCVSLQMCLVQITL